MNNISPDQIVDRIKLKRQLINWRLVALISICMLVISLFSSNDFDNSNSIIDSSYIARLKIEGLIINDLDRIEILSKIANDSSIKAVIVHINSPGATVVGGETLYQALRKISEAKKPVVVIMGDLATSGGYMASLGCDYLIANQSSITGSIGALMQTFEASELAHKYGIKFNTFKSSPLKGGPLPTEPLTPEVAASMEKVIKDIYNMFFELVAERRPQISREKLALIANGDIYTGRQALENGLIDAIGNEDTALDWFASVKKIDRSLKVRDIELAAPSSQWKKIVTSAANIMTFIETSTKTGIFSFL